MANSTPSINNSKPTKPYPDFPLFPHSTGRWAKKIRGKMHYFGKWGDWQAALEKFQKDFPNYPELPPVAETPKQPNAASQPEQPKPKLRGNPNSKSAKLKPYEGFPLYPHANGSWCKRIRGKLFYFGKLGDWQAALDKYNYEIPFLSKGLTPPPKKSETHVTVEDMCNLFLYDCDKRVQSGELSLRSFNDYKQVCLNLIDSFGRDTAAVDITREQLAKLREELSQKYNLATLANRIVRYRVVLNWAYKDGIIQTPINVSSVFSRPTAKALRIAKASEPPKIFTLDELKSLYQHSTPVMRCFMLLALNGGMGNSDIGQLKHRHLKDGWVVYPRPKTGVDRRFPLWEETAKAISEHATDGQGEDLVFLTRLGNSWFKADTGKVDCPIAKEFRKACDAAKCHQKNRGFYALRHQFRTIADAVCDPVATDEIMGHTDNSMGSHYREWVDPERLRKVAEHVRQWVAPIWQ